MCFSPEGVRPPFCDMSYSGLLDAMRSGTVLESRALSFDAQRRLHFRLGSFPAVMPHEECADGVAEGKIRDIALVTRVGRPVCFVITHVEIEHGSPLFYLSRTAVQRRCREEYLDRLVPGDILPCRITRAEPFGAFCDVGCGISALIPVDCLSVSRISSAHDRVRAGDDVYCAVKGRDAQGRLVLTMKELLGSWSENAARFAAGETVVGIVRSSEPYGVFIELAPNLSGLAEASDELLPGMLVSVFIKSILPEKMKIKLAVLSVSDDGDFRFPLRFSLTQGHLSRWRYSPEESARNIETVFDGGSCFAVE